MSCKLLTISDIDIWNKYLNKLPNEKQDVYFTAEYYALYEANSDGIAHCFVFEDGEHIAMYPFLKNSINSLGYKFDKEYFDIQGAYGYNGIISSSYDKHFIVNFWETFDNYCNENNIVAEFTRFHPLIQNQKFGEEHFEVVFDRHTVYANLLRSEEDIFNSFKSSTRKHIKKAAKTINIKKAINTKENIDIFYNIYVENMKKVNSVKYLFFSREHIARLFSINNVEFFIAYIGNEPIACFSGLLSNEYYGNYLRASRTEYNKTGVNTLMYWEMIKSAKGHGCIQIHFGGGFNSEINNSLLKYKMNFSSSLSDFYIGKKIHNENVYKGVVEQWKNAFPENYERNKIKLLGYREI